MTVVHNILNGIDEVSAPKRATRDLTTIKSNMLVAA